MKGGYFLLIVWLIQIGRAYDPLNVMLSTSTEVELVHIEQATPNEEGAVTSVSLVLDASVASLEDLNVVARAQWGPIIFEYMVGLDMLATDEDLQRLLLQELWQGVSVIRVFFVDPELHKNHNDGLPESDASDAKESRERGRGEIPRLFVSRAPHPNSVGNGWMKVVWLALIALEQAVSWVLSWYCGRKWSSLAAVVLSVAILWCIVPMAMIGERDGPHDFYKLTVKAVVDTWHISASLVPAIIQSVPANAAAVFSYREWDDSWHVLQDQAAVVTSEAIGVLSSLYGTLQHPEDYIRVERILAPANHSATTTWQKLAHFTPDSSRPDDEFVLAHDIGCEETWGDVPNACGWDGDGDTPDSTLFGHVDVSSYGVICSVLRRSVRLVDVLIQLAWDDSSDNVVEADELPNSTHILVGSRYLLDLVCIIVLALGVIVYTDSSPTFPVLCWPAALGDLWLVFFLGLEFLCTHCGILHRLSLLVLLYSLKTRMRHALFWAVTGYAVVIPYLPVSFTFWVSLSLLALVPLDSIAVAGAFTIWRCSAMLSLAWQHHRGFAVFVSDSQWSSVLLRIAWVWAVGVIGVVCVGWTIRQGVQSVRQEVDDVD